MVQEKFSDMVKAVLLIKFNSRLFQLGKIPEPIKAFTKSIDKVIKKIIKKHKGGDTWLGYNSLYIIFDEANDAISTVIELNKKLSSKFKENGLPYVPFSAAVVIGEIRKEGARYSGPAIEQIEKIIKYAEDGQIILEDKMAKDILDNPPFEYILLPSDKYPYERTFCLINMLGNRKRQVKSKPYFIPLAFQPFYSSYSWYISGVDLNRSLRDEELFGDTSSQEPNPNQNQIPPTKLEKPSGKINNLNLKRIALLFGIFILFSFPVLSPIANELFETGYPINYFGVAAAMVIAFILSIIGDLLASAVQAKFDVRNPWSIALLIILAIIYITGAVSFTNVAGNLFDIHQPQEETIEPSTPDPSDQDDCLQITPTPEPPINSAQDHQLSPTDSIEPTSTETAGYTPTITSTRVSTSEPTSGPNQNPTSIPPSKPTKTPKPNNRVDIGDRVWNDLDKDGIQDKGEPGIGGVTVRLLRSDGNFFATETTSGRGYYLFEDQLPGEYRLIFFLPSGYVFSPQNQGGGNVDSDPNPATGQTKKKVFLPYSTDLTIDAGMYKSTQISQTPTPRGTATSSPTQTPSSTPTPTPPQDTLEPTELPTPTSTIPPNTPEPTATPTSPSTITPDATDAPEPTATPVPTSNIFSPTPLTTSTQGWLTVPTQPYTRQFTFVHNIFCTLNSRIGFPQIPNLPHHINPLPLEDV